MIFADLLEKAGTAPPSGPVRPRILLYSHDTFGLGHIRRSRTIAVALAREIPGSSVVIVTGSPIVGRFDYAPGVDFVRVPGVVKLPSGDYESHAMRIDLAKTVALREGIIQSTAERFDPHLTIVDKEPSGFRGEMLSTLAMLRARGRKIVLGVRDVLDDPTMLAAEWDRKNAIEAVDRYYDALWVYGLKPIYAPMAGLKLNKSILERTHYTGYLRREPSDWPAPAVQTHQPNNFVLVTPGGGGDGDALVDWVLSAYESDPGLKVPAVIVFGPFLKPEKRREFELRAHGLSEVRTLSFDSRIERLMIEAAGVIAMGGYNTFCEILSFDKRAAISPRVTPRKEQFIRAEAAERFGLIRMLPPVEDPLSRDPKVMAEAIRNLPSQSRPSEAEVPGLLSGIDNVVALALGALQSFGNEAEAE